MKLKINERNGKGWIELEKLSRGKYGIINSSFYDFMDDEYEIGFCGWDETVINQDENSDPWQCFGIPISLQYKNVSFNYSVIEAKNIEEIKEALRHVAFCVWNRFDI